MVIPGNRYTRRLSTSKSFLTQLDQGPLLDRVISSEDVGLTERRHSSYHHLKVLEWVTVHNHFYFVGLSYGQIVLETKRPHCGLPKSFMSKYIRLLLNLFVLLTFMSIFFRSLWYIFVSSMIWFLDPILNNVTHNIKSRLEGPSVPFFHLHGIMNYKLDFLDSLLLKKKKKTFSTPRVRERVRSDVTM